MSRPGAGPPHPAPLKRKPYEAALKPMQYALVAMGRWLQHSRQRLVVVVEGRDTAGKGGTIGAIADYTRTREEMLAATHTAHAPRTLVEFNDQRRGRLTLIRALLDRLPDTCVPPPAIEPPPLPGKPLRERYGVLAPLPPFEA